MSRKFRRSEPDECDECCSCTPPPNPNSRYNKCQCLRECCTMVKNPVVLLFFTLFCFIQLIIIVASISNSHYQNRRATNQKAKSNTLVLDWQFRTIMKVVPVGRPVVPTTTPAMTKSTTLEALPNPSQKVRVPEMIQYGSEDFRYPLLMDMLDVVEKVRSGKQISVKPINDFTFPFIIPNKNKCKDGLGGRPVDLLVLIKSAPANAVPRHVIRETWGRESCWGGRTVRRLFLFGTVKPGQEALARQIRAESRIYGDVIQADFVDHYFNNTYKLMLGFQWATQHCRQARDIFFVDDDYFVQPKAVVAYLESISDALRRKLVSGYVWRVANPVRRKKGPAGKWFVAYSEYPWNTYPPYCSAGGFFVSMKVAQDLVIAMKYTRYLRFDDVFLGLVLHKLLMVPIHLTGVYSFQTVDKKSKAYPQVLASHGYKNPNDIFNSWFDLNADSFCVR